MTDTIIQAATERKRPKRIQRRRVKGWKMPPNTVGVTRPGKFGNPFSVKQIEQSGYRDGAAMAVWAFREWLNGNPDWVAGGNLHARQRILNDIRELRGCDLACWCKEDAPCHADVLLELANKP
jgi:hypothetical protein